MKGWNVVATSERFRERRLLKQLSPYGEFQRTGFRDVLRGRVENVDDFLEKLQGEFEKFPFNLNALSKVVPIDRTFEFTVEAFLERAKEVVRPYIETIDGGKFYIRIERRGHKGELDSHSLEQSLGAYLHAELERLGHHPATDFKDPDFIVAIETFADAAGAGLVRRGMKEKCRFVRIK